jgi:hypothetical protein
MVNFELRQSGQALREPILYRVPLAGASTSIYMRRICEDALAGERPKHNLM